MVKNKFKNDVYIYINEINFSKINKAYTNLIVFDDLIFSDKRISEFFTKGRKINSSCIFLSHRYFCIGRLTRNNLDYIIFKKLDKREISIIYNDISLDVSLKDFQNFSNNLKQYDFILID